MILLYFIIGARRIGKTLFFQRLACELYLRCGWTTVWLRNKKEELVDPDFGPGFLDACKRLGWCPQDWTGKASGIFDHDGSDKTRDPPKQIIKFQSLSTFSNRRGNEHASAMMMVLDEFMSEDRRYPKHAAIALMSLTKTIFSGRTEARAFCLSNFVSSANPYFVAFRLYPKRERDVNIYADRHIAVEICRGYTCAIEESNPWTALYRHGGYSDYADMDADRMFELITPMPRGCKPFAWTLLVDGQFYLAESGPEFIHWHRVETPVKNAPVYTPNITEIGADCYMVPKWLLKDLQELTELNTMRYKDPNVMFAVLSLIYAAI